ncbi:Uncharacterised protein [Klebsiella pneumoniae]|nr:Uncharacterised protein [Klebsiella pneumoniae]
METNKFTRHDFSETAFTLMQIIGDNREFEAKNREDYYQSATFSLNQLNALMAIDEAKTIANKRIVITLGGSLSFNLELKNYFDKTAGNASNLLIVFYVQIMPDDLVMQLHRF